MGKRAFKTLMDTVVQRQTTNAIAAAKHAVEIARQKFFQQTRSLFGTEPEVRLMTYREYQRTELWMRFKELRSLLVGGRCERGFPGCTGRNRLQLHHRRRPPRGTEDVERDLQLLCDNCHVIITASEKAPFVKWTEGELIMRFPLAGGLLRRLQLAQEHGEGDGKEGFDPEHAARILATLTKSKA